MKNTITTNKGNALRTAAALLLLTVMSVSSIQVLAQLPTNWRKEVFVSNIPGSPIYTSGSDFKNPQVDWYQAKIAGADGGANTFQWVASGLYPLAANINPPGFPAGAGFVRYINRMANYPGVSGATNVDAAFLASRSLDWSGHTTSNYLPNADTIGISIFRDNTAAALSVADCVQVLINTSPSMGGATLLTTTTGFSTIYRSTSLTPIATATPGWNRYQFVIPNNPTYTGATASSSVYIIVAAYSKAGDNIFLDNWNMPEWETAMTVTGISVVAPFTGVDMSKSSLNNLMLQMQITTKGSLTPKKIDGLTFSTDGSTNYASDVSVAKLWYTGGYTNFSYANGARAIPFINLSTPTYNFINQAFGYLSAQGCPGLTAPTTMNLAPGSDNYVWLAYDIAGLATPGNVVSVNMEQLFAGATVASCAAAGNNIITVNGIQNPTTPTNFVQYPSVSCVRPIDVSYPIPTYSSGTNWNSYNNNDFCSWVNLVGDNGTEIDNYYHDGDAGQILAACPGKISNTQNTRDRFACHPPDYTYFPPAVNGPTPNPQYKKRFVQVTLGHGVRTAPFVPYTVKTQAGLYTSSNCIGVFIDWNKDGDFDDSYNNVTGGLIKENYGTVCLTQGNMNAFPPSGAAVAQYAVSVPTLTDVVTNVNNTGGPPIIGTVTMRVREVFANSAINPTGGTATWGEIEDYKIQVLPDCPTLLSNVRKWVGGTTDWKDPNNWCPTLPTKDDIAYIAPGPANMPVILDSTNAVCRTLRIMPGASLTINAPKASSLKVGDAIEIGYGATTTTVSNYNTSAKGACIAVNSDFTRTLTIPGKNSIPPAGTALAPYTPFQNKAHTKAQIGYSAAELRGTYGWKKGDNIDEISIEVASITLAPAGPSTYQNFQIIAFQTAAPVAFPFGAPAGTKIAVYPGDANINSYDTIYSNPALTLNMPNATGGTQANGNYTTFNLKPNSLIWDGVSSLVLSFEFKTTIGAAPAKAYVLYNEGNAPFNVAVISQSTNDAYITGWNIVGPMSYINGVGAVTNSMTPTFPASPRTVTAVVTNLRPRLDFKWHRDYSTFPITVGGDFVNNNQLIRGSSYGTTTPVYNLPGDSGFIAGNSKVTFDPSIRAGVNSPGLGAPNASYYPGIPGVTLVQDMDQSITSTVSNGGNATIFNTLEIKKATTTGKVVAQKSAFTPYLLGNYADTLYLTTGELKLNRKNFTLKQGDTKALVSSGGGWLCSEDTAAPAGTIESKFVWKIGSVIGLHEIPFKGSGANVFKFKANLLSGDMGDLTVATYGTATNNTPYTNPTLPGVNPLKVTSMSTNPSPLVVDATPWTVDRFWSIKRSTNTTLTGTMTFEYNNSEATLTSSYVAGQMKAQYYGQTGANTGWHDTLPGQTDGTSAGVSWVNHPITSIDPTYNIWAIVHTTALQAPLPLELISFNAKAIDRKVKIWWDVMAERNVAKYNVERTADNKTFDVVAAKAPVGPSVDLLSYEAWDNNPLNGLQYYRLATNFTDGSTDYSNLVPVRFGTEGAFAINTVVTNGDATLTVNFTYDSQLPYTYMVTDMMGRVVATGENKKAVIGSNAIVIPVVLSNGIYTISLVNSEKAVSQKMFY